MLMCKKHFVLFIRTFSNTIKYPFSSEQICSKENRERCIKLMKHQYNQTKRTPDSFASVLIPMVNDPDRNGALSILYTIRSANLRTHYRQVAFPGGIKDPGDVTYADCALRETEEEIGIDRGNVDVWGEGQLVHPRLGPAIMPVVGYVPNFKLTDLRLNTNEVEKVFTVPIMYLSSVKCKKHTQFRAHKGYSIPVYTCGEQRVWGITAVITNLFLYSLLPKEVYITKLNYVHSYRRIES